MAVQQNKKSPSKRGMHRSHDFLTSSPLTVDSGTGEVHCAITSAPTVITGARKSSKQKKIKFRPIVLRN